MGQPEIIRQKHRTAAGENIGRSGHEMHTAEDDELGPRLRGGQLRQFQTIPGEIGVADDVVVLVVVAEHDQPIPSAVLAAQCAGPFRQCLTRRIHRQLLWVRHAIIIGKSCDKTSVQA